MTFELKTLESLIHSKILLVPDSNGWHCTKCPICNDYKIRAGFIVSGDTITYNCWNCGTKAKYTEFSGEISKNFKKILSAFGIDDSDISEVVNSYFFHNKEKPKEITLDTLLEIDTSTPKCSLPRNSFRLGYHDSFSEQQERICAYLESRCVDILKYPFYFSVEERFVNSVIIPYYRNGQIIFWQARSILPGKSRYDNAPVGRNAVMFNMDKLHSFSSEPLIVTEGVFDAMMFDGISLTGSSLNEAKIHLLSQAKRNLIFIIDKDGNGKHLAEKVLQLKLGRISFLPDSADDLNKSVQIYGKLWTAYQIMNNIPNNDDSAKMMIDLYCKDKNGSRKTGFNS